MSTDGMWFSLDGGEPGTWLDVSPEDILPIAGVTAENGVLISYPGNGITTRDSETQVITVTKAEQPKGLTAAACQTPGNADGAITGLNSVKLYEYRLSTASAYTSVDLGATSITGLAPGSYFVREKAGGTMLASEDAEALTVAPYTPAEQAAAPLFTPIEGTYYADTLEVTLTCATEDASIYYTTDGTAPTADSTLYGGPITLNTGATTVKAVAVKYGWRTAAWPRRPIRSFRKPRRL